MGQIEIQKSIQGPPDYLQSQPVEKLIPNRQRLNIPDTLRILINHAIRGEEPHPRNAGNALAYPLLAILERLVYHLLRLDVRIEVVRDKIVVAMLGNGSEKSREVRGIAECAGANSIKNTGELRIESEAAVHMFVPDFFNVFGEISKEKDVLFANFAGNFDLSVEWLVM